MNINVGHFFPFNYKDTLGDKTWNNTNRLGKGNHSRKLKCM